MGKYTEDSVFHKSGVYEIRCLHNNRVYVGSSNNIGQRASSHFRKLANQKHINKYLQYDYDQYGFEQFQFKVLEYCLVEQLIEREQFWIAELKATEIGIGYNCKSVPVRHQMNAASRRKLSDSVRGFKHSEETKKQISAAMTGRERSLEHRLNLSKANKGQIPWITGKSQSEYQKRRASEALQGNKHFFGKRHSLETIEKMKQAQKARWAKRKAK